MVRVEVCVDGPDGALAAQQGGAHRIELCSALALGGLTPSAGLLEAVREHVTLPLAVMIRPRRGDFCYSPAEFDVALRDVAAARAAGAAAVVFGALDPDGDVDTARVRELIAAARPMEVCFHRALDLARDPLEAFEVLCELGVDRVLSSGGAPSAEAGAETLAEMVRRSGGRTQVMAGGGVRAANVRDLVARTGALEVHLSAARTVPGAMRRLGAACDVRGTLPEEHELVETDAREVRAVLAELDGGRTE